MSRAVLYARVSSSLQKKEGTIESQILELKKQIIESGDVLVNEYIDEGFSGARLDRPAMNELREDIKKKEFEKIYFLNTDRIAREVTYQTIIIGEILKHKKQIIINGQDYVHNPENKFTLTILGAVAELERAKIIERITRSKQMRISQGSLSGSGCPIYGYDHIPRTPTSPPQYVINEKEAKTVRYIFETYAQGEVGMQQITRYLEEQNIPTKQGKKLWRIGRIKYILKNDMYRGVRYYNMMKTVREYGNPITGEKGSRVKFIKRDKSEWKPVPVPAIVSEDLFQKVQKRMEYNRKKYRNPNRISLLSNLGRCGVCGGSLFCYRTQYVDKRSPNKTMYKRSAYKCNKKDRSRTHAKKNRTITECKNPELQSDYMEYSVFQIIEKQLFDPKELKANMEFFKRRRERNEQKVKKELDKNSNELLKQKKAKNRLLDLYAQGVIEQKEYVDKNIEIDELINDLEENEKKLFSQIPLLYKKNIVNQSIKEFCIQAKVAFSEIKDFDSKRSFALKYIDHFNYSSSGIEVHGVIPIKESNVQGHAVTNLPFVLKGEVIRKKK